jgi:hypothetical protein
MNDAGQGASIRIPIRVKPAMPTQQSRIDFMHFGSENGPDRALWHTQGMTRIESRRRVAEMIRAMPICRCAYPAPNIETFIPW